MSEHSEMTQTLEVLSEKLQVLDTMTEVNGFLVESLRDNADAFKKMSDDETRALLRQKARARYRTDGGTAPNPTVLAMIEETLGKGQSAQIIPFAPRS